jgi:uncharacterized protein (TIRG00374 family)
MRRDVLLFGLSAGLLGFVVWRTRPWEAASIAAELDWRLLLLALLLNAVVVALWAERSRSLMAAVGSPLSLRTLVPVVAFANTINNLTPASAGEVLRALVLRRRHDVPYDRSTAVILAERLWAIGVMLVSGVAAAFGTVIPARAPIVTLAWLAALALSFAPSVVYRLGLRPTAFLGRLVRRMPAPGAERLASGLAAVDDQLGKIVLDPRRSLHFVVVTALAFTTFAAQIWLVLQALGEDVAIAGAWAAYGLAICAGVISALPFGLGAADAVLVALLVAQGVDVPVAGATAILLRAVTTLPLGVAGTISWIILGRAGRAALESTA